MSDIEVLETAAGVARLRRSKRTTLSISVHPDGSLELGAPLRAGLDDIRAKVAKRATWIRRQQRVFAVMNATRAPRRFSSGATHRYLGRQYRLKVSKGKSPGVKLSGGYFHVTAEHGSEAEVEMLLASWMREHANEQFTKRLDEWRRWCQQHRLPPPRMILRAMPKRWGSAHSDGRIALNPELVRAPSVCIDYVIAHEVCHLKHPDHGPDFYGLLNQVLPGWQNTKRRLETAEI